MTHRPVLAHLYIMGHNTVVYLNKKNMREILSSSPLW